MRHPPASSGSSFFPVCPVRPAFRAFRASPVRPISPVSAASPTSPPSAVPAGGRRRVLLAAGIPLAAFLLAAAVWTAVLILFGVAPFGERSLLITDLSQQYMEYHVALYDAARGGGILLYTWNGGLGMNFVGLFAYYLASPFTGLILLFPRALLPEAVLLVISLKLAGSALTMAVFLRQGAGVRGAAGPLFAVLYALSGYSAAFFFNLMWFDAVLLLPLVLLGVRRLAVSGRMAPLAAGYTALFLSNYYAAYMAGVFSLLFLLALCCARRLSLRETGRRALRLLGAAAIAAGLGAFLLLPAYLALRESQGGAGLSLPWIGLTTDPLTLLSKLSFGAYDSVTDQGTPNLYCGVLVLGLLPACLLHRGIPRREKLAGGLLAGFLLLCMLIAPLDTLWHGGQPPVWFPCRYAFCLILLLVTAAARAFSRPDGLQRWHVLAGFGFSAVLMLAAKAPDWLFPGLAVPFPGRLAVTLVLLAAYAGLLLLWRSRRRLLKRAALALLALALPAELAGNALSVLRSLDGELGFESRGQFSAYLETEAAQADRLEAACAQAASSSGLFCRAEDRTPHNPNDGLVRGFPSLSHYSSLSRRETFRFLKNLGMNVVSANKLLRYGGSTSALDALLGVRYVFAEQELRPGMTAVGRDDAAGGTLWENKSALPLAYFADAAVLSVGEGMEDGASPHPFALQNALFAGLGGEEWENAPFYRPLAARADCRGGTLTPREGEQAGVAGIRAEEEDARLVVTIENPERQHVLLYFPNNLPGNGLVLLDGRVLNANGEWLMRGVIDLGLQPAGTVEVSFPVSGESYWLGEVQAAGFDEALFSRLSASLREGAPSRLQVDGTRVSLEITAPRDGVIFTSIPGDEGWSVWVDGRKTAAETVADAFLCVPVSAGTHRIVLRFFPRGLAAGAGITVLTALLCAAAGLFRRRSRRRDAAPT